MITVTIIVLIQFRRDILLSLSGPGVLLEGKLMDVSRHSVSDIDGQKVHQTYLFTHLFILVYHIFFYFS